MGEVAKMLQEYGGWGVAAACIAAIWYLVKRIEQKDKALEDRNAYVDQLHKESRDDNKEMVEALITTRNAIRSLKDVITLLVNRPLAQPQSVQPPVTTGDDSE
jgi:hypothetical protein